MPTFVPGAGRTLALFEVFARERRELSNSDLARLMDLAESSCSDLLYTLHQTGYLSRTASSKRFYPTSRLLAAAKAITENDYLNGIGTEAVELLSEKTGETAVFAQLDGSATRVVAVHEGVHRLRYVISPGDRVSLHAAAVGKALLGQVSEAERARLLRLKPLGAFTRNTVTDPKKLETEIKKHRRIGWYQAVNEGAEGTCSFSASGMIGMEVVGLSMVGPSDRMEANKEWYLKMLNEVVTTVFGENSKPEPAEEKQAGQKSSRAVPRRKALLACMRAPRLL